LGSGSEQRATIVKAPEQQQPLSTIYVSSGDNSGQYKTYLVTNNNPITLKSLGFTNGPNGKITFPTETSSNSIPESASSSVDISSSSTIIKATSLDPTQLMHQNHHQPIAQGRMSDFVNDIIAKSPIKPSPLPKSESGEDPIVVDLSSSIDPVSIDSSNKQASSSSDTQGDSLVDASSPLTEVFPSSIVGNTEDVKVSEESQPQPVDSESKTESVVNGGEEKKSQV
jgi:hypothetical protein